MAAYGVDLQQRSAHRAGLVAPPGTAPISGGQLRTLRCSLRSRGSAEPAGRRKGRRRPSRCSPRADISRRRGLPASFLARRITSRCCHTPVPGAGLRLGGAGAHGGCARRGQPGLCCPPALFEVSGAGFDEGSVAPAAFSPRPELRGRRDRSGDGGRTGRRQWVFRGAE